jgi:cytidylate kinase
MAHNLLIPSIEERMRGYIELSRRNVREHGWPGDERAKPTVTITREFGCEGYPVATALQAILEKRSGQPWVVMDRALLEKVAEDHHLSAEMLKEVGGRGTIMDEILSTFSPRWKSDKDYYRLLTRQIVSLAQEGNVILVGRGASVLTQNTRNSFHFRIVAPTRFKVETVRVRMGIGSEEAARIVEERQHQREQFLRDFLGRDITDPTLYHLIFNNSRCPAQKIAELMAELIMPL